MLFYIVDQYMQREKYASILDFLDKNSCVIEFVKSSDEFIHLAGSIGKDVVIIISDNGLPATEIEQLIANLNANTHIFYLSDKINPSLYKIFSRAKNIEVVEWSSAVSDISKYINSRDSETNRELVSSQFIGNQHVISFVGVGGGVGNTTLSIEVGIDIATSVENKKQGKVALLDLDSSGSQMCDYLNIVPRLDLSDVAKNPGRLDAYMLEIMSSKHSSGLDVYSPKNPFYAVRYREPSIAYLSLLNCIVDNYSTTLIDIPNNCVIDTSEILKNSDLIFCVGIFSVPSAKKIKEKIDYMLSMNIPREIISIIITDTDTNYFGKLSHRFSIDSVFQGFKITYIRRDRIFAMECADTGQSMMQTESKRGVCKDIHAISEIIHGL